MRILLRMMALLLATTVVALAEMRTWTFAESGKTMQGEIAGFTANAVTLKDANGKTVSVPIASLSQADRTFLARDQAQQWKELEVVRLYASQSAGPYKKCDVRGTGAAGGVFVRQLPASVETVLAGRNQQFAQIDGLTQQIERQTRAVQEAKEALPAKGSVAPRQRRTVAAERARVNAEESNLHALKATRAQLQKACDDSVQKTKAQTMVRMRNTGLVYKGLPIWQCFDPRQPQP